MFYNKYPRWNIAQDHLIYIINKWTEFPLDGTFKSLWYWVESTEDKQKTFNEELWNAKYDTLIKEFRTYGVRQIRMQRFFLFL